MVFNMRDAERPTGTAVYVQVPFCPERCEYCSIPVSTSHLQLDGYLEALEREVSRILPDIRLRSIVSLYVGGGSPTSIPPHAFERLLSILSPILSRDISEITFESRPDALSNVIMEQLKPLPNLRLSLGVESLDRSCLDTLGRKAPLQSPLKLLEKIRHSCLSAQVSMDFIVTGKDFDIDQFLTVCRELGDNGLDHLSIYPLVIEDQTVLSLRKSQNKTEADWEESAGENWHRSCEGLSYLGWKRYEVSNFRKISGKGCLHNLHVWKGGETFGLGPGAHQTIQSVRYENVRSLNDYIRKSRDEDTHPYELREALSEEQMRIELLYTSLRLETGLSVEWILRHSFPEKIMSLIDIFVRNGYGNIVRNDGERFVLTDQGLFRLDEIVSSFLECLQSGSIIR